MLSGRRAQDGYFQNPVAETTKLGVCKATLLSALYTLQLLASLVALVPLQESYHILLGALSSAALILFWFSSQLSFSFLFLWRAALLLSPED